MKKLSVIILMLCMVISFSAISCTNNQSSEKITTDTTKTQVAEESTAKEEAVDFDWKAFEGSTINLLLVQHPWTDEMVKRLDQFTSLSGIKVTYDILPEEEFFDKLTIVLSSGSTEYDAFMIGAQQVWQYAPPKFLEPLDSYMDDPTKTNSDWNVNDIFPNLLGAGKWDLTDGHEVGNGPQWALPWVFHTSTLVYRKDIFDKHNLNVPTNLDELYEVAVKVQDLEPDMYGIAARGTRSWATIHPSVISWFTSYGGKDFDEDGKCVLNANPDAVAAHDLWGKIMKEAGPPAYSTTTWYEVASDFGQGRAAMMYEADVIGYYYDVPGSSDVVGKMAWAPPPGKPGGINTSGLWIWMLGMNANSLNKDASWYLLQWATSKDVLADSAINGLAVDPIRKSIWEMQDFEDLWKDHTDYYKTFNEIIDNTKLWYTPQQNFFEFTTEWSSAIQKIVSGESTAQTALDEVASKLNAK